MILLSFKFKYVRMAIVDHRPITVPNEKNKIYFIINGDIFIRYRFRLKNNNPIVNE